MSDWHNSVEYQNRNRAERIADVRELCNMLEQHPDIPMPDFYFSHNIAVQKSGINAVSGEWETEYDSLEMVNLYAKGQKAIVEYDPNATQHVPDPDRAYDDPYTRVTFPNGLSYRLTVSRSNTCEKVIVGYEMIEAKPEKVIAAEPEKLVPKYEYRCNDRIAKVVVPKGVRVEG